MTDRHRILGWPIVSAVNVFGTVREAGIKPFRTVVEPQPISSWINRATEPDRRVFDRFGPKSVAMMLEDHKGKPDLYFRTAFSPSVMVFGLLDGMVPITAEWKHGNGKITLVPVAGVAGKAEADLPSLYQKMKATAFREWHEETGTELSALISLGPKSGLYTAVRQADIPYFPFCGAVKTPIERRPTKFDENENLLMVLFPLSEWIELIEGAEYWDSNPDFGIEATARDVTYRALRALGKLKI